MASLLAGAPIAVSTAPLRGGKPIRRNYSRLRGISCAAGAGRIRERRMDRREILLASGVAVLWSLGAEDAHAAAGAFETAEEAASNPLIQKLLESSRANKAAYDAARLEDYYKRNFKEYFEFVEGSVRNKKDMTPAEKAIVEWLAKNK